MITNEQKEDIAKVVIATLALRFSSFPTDTTGNRNAPFHEAFLNAFQERLNEYRINVPTLISLSSWMHGLNTTLGMSFFEKTAQILSNGTKRGFTNNNRLSMFEEQKIAITSIMENLKNGTQTPSLQNEDNAICLREGRETTGVNFTLDVCWHDNAEFVGIELKSVKPNAGEVQGEKTKLLKGKASLYKQYPTLNIKYFFGFPFDPTSETPTAFDKERFLGNLVDGTRYLDPDEILVGAELWDYLSGTEGTMEVLLEIIKAIATPNFMNNINFLNSEEHYRDFSSTEYEDILRSWNLHKEIEFRTEENIEIILTSENNSLIRTFNQEIIKTQGKYNEKRILKLLEFINTQ